jgi:hypothetical protein
VSDGNSDGFELKKMLAVGTQDVQVLNTLCIGRK